MIFKFYKLLSSLFDTSYMVRYNFYILFLEISDKMGKKTE